MVFIHEFSITIKNGYNSMDFTGAELLSMEMSRNLVILSGRSRTASAVNLKGELFSNINNDELSLSIQCGFSA